MKRLDRVHERRPVALFEDVRSYLNDAVRSDSQEAAVEGGVVQLAQRQTVPYGWLALGIGVRHDVRGVE